MNAALQNTGHTKARDNAEVRTEYPTPGVQVHTFHTDNRTQEERQADKETRLASFINFRPSSRCFI